MIATDYRLLLHSNSDRLKLNIVVPQCGVKMIIVRNISQIKILDQIFCGEKVYIHRGQVLQKTMQFSQYDIRSDDCIVAYCKNLYNVEKNQNGNFWKWFHMSMDQEEMNTRIFRAINPSLSKENARLRDLRMNRYENLKKVLRRRENCSYPSCEIMESKAPAPATTMSTEPLPKFWH